MSGVLKLRLLAFAMVWFLPVVVASATDSTEPALEPDTAVLAKLEALGDNSCCILDGTRIIEDLGDFAKGWHRMKETGPTGRDFTIKMVWMPDRKRAFFCGANHNSPHRFNDAWEYDLASNTWVLLYTPDYNDRGPITDDDKQTLVLQDGWLRTKKGGPAHPAHTPGTRRISLAVSRPYMALRRRGAIVEPALRGEGIFADRDARLLRPWPGPADRSQGTRQRLAAADVAHVDERRDAERLGAGAGSC